MLHSAGFRRSVFASLALTFACALWISWSRSELVAPQPTVIVSDSQGQFLATLGEDELGREGFWPLELVPPRVAAAMIAIEDRRFDRHPGVDLIGIARAAKQNFQEGRVVSGASTLAMQVARMQQPARRVLSAKAIEASTALVMTARHGREAVLAHYLRIVPYGNRIHGIGYAARRYFGKPVADLSWAEIAFLAAIPQSPSRMNPLKPEGRRLARQRGARILELLADQGLLDEVVYAEARAQLASLRPRALPTRRREALHAVLGWADELREVAPEGGVVSTTLELDLQGEVEDVLAAAVERWSDAGAGNAAAYVIELNSGDLLARVASTDYFDAERAGAIDYGRTRRSPGSTLKPFLFALAYDRGLIDPATVLDDLRRGAGGIANADGRWLGPMLPRAALANSRNVPAVALIDEIGLERAWQDLVDAGLGDGIEPASHWGLGLAIGNMPVSLEELSSAYLALATDGRVRPLRWRQEAPRDLGQPFVSETAARLVSLHLADPMARLPSFPRMGHLEYAWPVAVKTGTSSDFRDAWAVAWSRDHLVAVWVGHPDWREMQGLTGYSSAAQLVREIHHLLETEAGDGLEDTGMPLPRGFESVRLCGLSGHRPGPACPRVVNEPFDIDRAPAAICRVHRLVTEAKGVRTVVDLGPDYLGWLADQGLAAPVAVAAEIGVTSIALAEPARDLQVLRDPETPIELSSLALSAVVEGGSALVRFLVDGRTVATVGPPYRARWQLEAGQHTLWAEIAGTETRSRAVEIVVR